MIFVSIGKICELLGISLSTAYRWIKSGKLLNYAQSNNFNNIKVTSDLGSGLNFKKSGLNQLLHLILTQQINTLIINHKDRL